MTSPDASPERTPRPGVAYLTSSRVEAFSDGVLAIAITLLVLDLVVPARHQTPSGTLGHALAEEWPSYGAYLVSFMVVGIMWVNHHTVFAKVRRVDRPVLFANLALLLCISVLPFPTRLLAEYLTSGPDSHLAAAVYSGTMLAAALCFTLLWWAVTRDEHLLHDEVDRQSGRAALRRFGAGGIVYLATIGLSFVSAPLTLAVHFVLAVYYCFDQLTVAAPPPS